MLARARAGTASTVIGAVVVVAAGLLSSCSGSSGDPGKPLPSLSLPTLPAPKPFSSASGSSLATNTRPKGAASACQLVTRAEAGAALGVPVGVGVDTPQTDPSIGFVGSCAYKATDAKAHPATLVNVLVLGTTVAQKSFEKQLHARAPQATPLPGLGDEAFSSPGVVYVFDKGAVLGIEATLNTDPVAVAKIVPLARAAVSRSSTVR